MVVAQPLETTQLTPEQEEHAAQLHADSIVIDGSSVVNPEHGAH